MTTPPKARAYRISREESVLAVGQGPRAVEAARKVQVEVHRRAVSTPPEQAPEQLFSTSEDGFGDMRFPGAAKEPAQPAQDTPPMAERLTAVRAEI